MSKYKIELDSSKMVYGSIRRYSDGYSYASMAIKMNDDEVMHINYEWSGKSIPEFAMHVMDMLKTMDKEKAATLIDGETFERASKVMLDSAKENKKEE